MTDQKHEFKAKLMTPIGPAKPGVATWYKDREGNYTIAAIVAGVAGILFAIYVVH